MYTHASLGEHEYSIRFVVVESPANLPFLAHIFRLYYFLISKSRVVRWLYLNYFLEYVSFLLSINLKETNFNYRIDN
jgi:hypothetical protein